MFLARVQSPQKIGGFVVVVDTCVCPCLIELTTINRAVVGDWGQLVAKSDCAIVQLHAEHKNFPLTENSSKKGSILHTCMHLQK
jgi:hypothetical protein